MWTPRGQRDKPRKTLDNSVVSDGVKEKLARFLLFPYLTLPTDVKAKT